MPVYSNFRAWIGKQQTETIVRAFEAQFPEKFRVVDHAAEVRADNREGVQGKEDSIAAA